MAKQNRYQEKRNPVLTVLYILAILVLVAALAFMYKTYRDKRMQYDTLVEEASMTEQGFDIESRKAPRETAEEAVTPEPTATPEPTEAPTAVPTEAPTEAPVETEAAETPETEVFIPDEGQNSLVDESLSKGIN